jgi:hypothetical protein
LTPGISAGLDLTENNILMNVGRCHPQMWGFRWGDVKGDEITQNVEPNRKKPALLAGSFHFVGKCVTLILWL